MLSLKEIRLLLILLSYCVSVHAFSQRGSDSVQFVIFADNLSEDKNLLATKNDEIIFQLYAVSGAEILDEPLLYQVMFFDQEHRTNRVAIPMNKLDTTYSYFVYMIEYEYDKSYEQRAPVYRIYHEQINAAFNQSAVTTLKKYLGSDDLLGMQELAYEELVAKTKIEFEGFQNLEKFKYIIHIE
ncbi:MAG: hypothetical protein AAF551_11375 [Bacteroidota bacterium]